MARYSLTALMGVVLAGLVGYVYFVELPGEQAKIASDTAEKKIVPFTEQDITGLALQSDTVAIQLQLKDGTWQMTSPLQTEADPRIVNGMVRALVLGRVTRVVEESGATLAPFGLEKPSVVLTVSADSTQEVLAIGDPGPISSTLYAIRTSDQKVLLTDLAAKDFLNKSVTAFRKKEILRVDVQQADRLRLTYPQTEIVLYRGDHKDNKSWTVRYPIEASADQPEVKTLLIKLEDLKALAFIDPGPQHTEQMKRLTKPDLKVTIHAGGAEQTVKLFQPDSTTGEAFAVTSSEAPIYRINPMALKDLKKDLFALRDKRLLGVSRDELAMLEVKTRDQHYTLIRQNDTWVLEQDPNQRLDQERVSVFVARVVDLPAEIRIVKQPGPLAPYGLSSPSAEFIATTKDGKASGRLVLGTRSGGLVYAMGRGLPGIYQARADLLTQIPSKDELLGAGSEGA